MAAHNKNATTWQKGKSGNPGGQSPRIGPNGETAASLARIHSPKAFERLAKLIDSANEEVALKAIVVMLDRAWGKVKEPKEDGGEGSKTVAEELLALLATRLPD